MINIGPSETYTLEKARELASYALALFKRESLDAAVREAVDEQAETGEAGLVRVFIPCNTTSLTPSAFQELLVNPTAYPLVNGDLPDPNGPKIYGRRNSAYHGRTKSGREHPGFLVYVPPAAVIVDLINRDGESLVNPAIRSEYISALEKELGFPVAYKVRPLSN